MEDGTKYDTNRNGVFEVENPAHLEAIKQSPNYRLGHMGKGGVRVSVAELLEDNFCENCSFNRYPWQVTCPRCGHNHEGQR